LAVPKRALEATRTPTSTRETMRQITLFKSNPRRVAVRKARGKARRKGKWVARDLRTKRIVARGRRSSVASYGYNLYPKVAKPRFGKRKAVRSNPTPAKKRKGAKRVRKASAKGLGAIRSQIKALKRGQAQTRRELIVVARGLTKLAKVVRRPSRKLLGR
jgi:hypothetical protein